jgi:hypothetical protein
VQYRYYIVDVFSRTPFGGNQLAVLPEAEGINSNGMQAVAREFILPKLRHVRVFRDAEGIVRHMQRHREIIAPKFATVLKVFQDRLGSAGVGRWINPRGSAKWLELLIEVSPGLSEWASFAILKYPLRSANLAPSKRRRRRLALR